MLLSTSCPSEVLKFWSDGKKYRDKGRPPEQEVVFTDKKQQGDTQGKSDRVRVFRHHFDLLVTRGCCSLQFSWPYKDKAPLTHLLSD